MEENKNNNISNQTTGPEEPLAEGTIFKEKESKMGPMIGSIIIIIIIIVGGLYFWGTYIEEIKKDTQTPEEKIIEEVEDVENELEDLNLDELDLELEAIDEEFDSI